MRMRADLLLVKKKLVSSRSEAQSLILAGKVYSSHGRVEKPSQLFPEAEILEVRQGLAFVSRGGVKLEGALKAFAVSAEGKICLDVGASTGGFTDCLLQRGATRVFAVDVGYGQFHWKLRNDPRVVLLEKTNFRNMDLFKISSQVDLVVADVSFISLEKILPNVYTLLKKEGEAVILVKPQFELSREEVKKGVVRVESLREKAVQKVATEAKRLGFEVKQQAPSPILGPAGNQEYFLHLLK